VQEIVKRGGNWGFDASADAFEPQYVDMLAAGIIDPVKVTRSGVEHAASAAAVLLTTEAAVADEPEDKKDMPATPGMSDMGGMDY
jgi:chaperonin GroEL